MKNFKLRVLAVVFLGLCGIINAESPQQKKMPVDEIERTFTAICSKCGKTYIKDTFHICKPQ